MNRTRNALNEASKAFGEFSGVIAWWQLGSESLSPTGTLPLSNERVEADALYVKSGRSGTSVPCHNSRQEARMYQN